MAIGNHDLTSICNQCWDKGATLYYAVFTQQADLKYILRNLQWQWDRRVKLNEPYFWKTWPNPLYHIKKNACKYYLQQYPNACLNSANLQSLSYVTSHQIMLAFHSIHLHLKCTHAYKANTEKAETIYFRFLYFAKMKHISKKKVLK